MARFSRYTLSHQKEDLDKSILHFTEAIFLPDILAKPFHNTGQILFHLAKALLVCSEDFEQPDGIKYSMEYIRYLRGYPVYSFDIPRTDVTTLLIRALRTQVMLGAGNGIQDINEIMVLCNELLSSSKSTVIPAAAFRHLGEAAWREFKRGLPIEMLEEVIGFLRYAVEVYPIDSYDAYHGVMYTLAFTLGIRFAKTHSKKDYEEASVILERILEPGGCPDSFRDVPSAFAIVLANGRSAFFREPEYHEIVISRIRAYSSSPSIQGRRLFIRFDLRDPQ
jgi:hypothetical protein